MTKNPLLILCLFLLLHNQKTAGLSGFSTLQLEAWMDQLHTAIHTMERVNSLAHSDFLSNLPDMKKMLEAVEKIPL